MSLLLLDLVALSFHLLELLLVLLPYQFLLFLKQGAELRSLLYLLTSYQHLGVQSPNLLFKPLLLLPFHDVLAVPLLKGIDSRCLILLCPALLLLKLDKMRVRTDVTRFLIQFLL